VPPSQRGSSITLRDPCELKGYRFLDPSAVMSSENYVHQYAFLAYPTEFSSVKNLPSLLGYLFSLQGDGTFPSGVVRVFTLHKVFVDLSFVNSSQALRVPSDESTSNPYLPKANPNFSTGHPVEGNPRTPQALAIQAQPAEGSPQTPPSSGSQ